MQHQVGMGDRVEAGLVARPGAQGSLRLGGHFTLEHYRDGQLIATETTHNLVVNQGLDHALDVVLHGTTPTGTWYVAIVETNTAAAATMTYAVPAYTENTTYTEATRPAYVEAAASSQSTTNSSNKASFTINGSGGSKTIYGASLVSVNTKGDTAGGGILFSYGLFSGGRAVVDGDTLQVTYTINGSSS